MLLVLSLLIRDDDDDVLDEVLEEVRDLSR